MGFYEKHILPRGIDWVMRFPAAATERHQLVPQARGTVLEVGIGSGLNLPFYDSSVSRLYGLDPSPELRRMAEKRAIHAPFPVDFLGTVAEEIPLASDSTDTVLTTWTLCSVDEPDRALAEMRRVLRPDGRLIFIEHGRSPEASVSRWQHRLDPIWTRFAGGCRLTRPMDELIRQAGFRLARQETGYIPGPRLLSYHYRGIALKD
ncbi:MAG: class I SAM-dependent methyltransferase [Rhodospirillales bacterium]|nr:class I SAM-dependent methyltransferase [Rhodospirillales bacterium]